MPPPPHVIDRHGLRAVVDTHDGDRIVIRLDGGAAIDLPASLVTSQADGSLAADVSFEDLGAERTVLREVEEQVHIEPVVYETGRVVARTVTGTTHESVDAAGWRETVEVERIPVGRVVDAVEGPREEGDVTVVPVYEEVLVVTKRLVLREEVRLTRRREPVAGSEPVALRRQRVEVERLPPDPASE